YDATMIPIWQKVYAKVLAEYQAGTIHWTHDLPAAQQLVADPKPAPAAIVNAVAGAAGTLTGTTPDRGTQVAQLQTAGTQHAAAQDSTKALGSALPPPAVHPTDVAAAVSTVAANPPPVTGPADVAKAMQVASAGQHAADVAKAHGLEFHMPDSGAAPVPSYTATKWTPLIAFGAVAAAIGVGSLIQNAATRHVRSYRPRTRSRRYA